jgi:hypothetical protein
MGFLKKRVPIMDTLLSNEVKTPKIPDLSEVEVRDLGDLPEGFEIDISDAVSDESGETVTEEVIEIIEIEDADAVIPKTEDAESEPQGETKE